MFSVSLLASLLALTVATEAGVVAQRQDTCPSNGPLEIEYPVVSYTPVVINQYFENNTVININGGITININNAPTSLSTTVTATTTSTSTSTVTVPAQATSTTFNIIATDNAVVKRQDTGNAYLAGSGAVVRNSSEAALFVLTNGNLFSNGVQISIVYPGASSYVFSSTNSGPVNSVFLIVEGLLIWRNALFANSQASFCLLSGSLFVVLDGSSISGCVGQNLIPVPPSFAASASSSASASSAAASSASSASSVAATASPSSTVIVISSSGVAVSSTTVPISSMAPTAPATSTLAPVITSASSTVAVVPSSVITSAPFSNSTISSTVPSATSASASSSVSTCGSAQPTFYLQALGSLPNAVQGDNDQNKYAQLIADSNGFTNIVFASTTTAGGSVFTLNADNTLQSGTLIADVDTGTTNTAVYADPQSYLDTNAGTVIALSCTIDASNKLQCSEEANTVLQTRYGYMTIGNSVADGNYIADFLVVATCVVPA